MTVEIKVKCKSCGNKGILVLPIEKEFKNSLGPLGAHIIPSGDSFGKREKISCQKCGSNKLVRYTDGCEYWKKKEE